MSATACVFCGYNDYRRVVADLGRVLVISPLNPVTTGHLLFLPREHIENATASPPLTGLVFEKAAEWAATESVGPCNLITSVGVEATQSVMHLHVHLVPRRAGDGLRLPWSVALADSNWCKRLEAPEKPDGWPDKCARCGALWTEIGYDHADGFNCRRCGGSDADE